MGLSERRTKQKIGNDPRNLAWRQDTTSFGAQFLAKAGHTAGTALGLTPSNGLVNPIAVARKLDNSGIGVGRARREGDAEGGGAGGAGTGLDELLKRLRGDTPGSGSGSESGERVLGGFAKAGVKEERDTIVVGKEESQPVASGSGSTGTVLVETEVVAVELPKVRRLAHRQKNLAAKRLASQSPLAMSEILGIRSGAASPSPFPSPSPLGTPITSFESEPNPMDSITDSKGELTTTAKLSVGDYFKQRMEEKRKGFEEAMRLAREKAGGAPEVASGSGSGLGVEEEIVVVGGGGSAAPAVVASAFAPAAAVEESEEESSEEEEVVAETFITHLIPPQRIERPRRSFPPSSIPLSTSSPLSTMSSTAVATPEAPAKITKTSLFAKTESTGNLESLLLWLNNQGDILTSFLVHFAGVKEEAELIQIKEMDDHGFDLIYCLLSSDEGVMSESRVNFDAPLKRWKEARPKMLSMRDEASKALAMKDNPSLPPFTNPPIWPEQALIITLLVIQFLTFALPDSTTLPMSLFSDIRAVVGLRFVKFSYLVLVVAHVSEAVWFWNKLSNQGVKGGDLRKWVYWTLAFGLVVSGSHYKRQIQVARIRDIYAKVSPTPASKPTSKAKVAKGRVGESKKKQ